MNQRNVKPKKSRGLILFALILCLSVVSLFTFGVRADSPTDADADADTDFSEVSSEATNYTSNGDTGLDTGSDTALDTVRIRPAEAILGELSASGNIELIHTHQIALATAGNIDQIAVTVGDQVKAGEILFTIDAQELELELAKAHVDLELANVDLAKAAAKDTGADLAVAEAELRTKQEVLQKTLAGPTEKEAAAAQSRVEAATAKYNELQAGPQSAAINQALASLKKAEVSLREAQSAYNEVKWLPEIGAMPQATQLERATLDAEYARAVYEQATSGATSADLQSAWSVLLEAQHNLEQLMLKPTAGEIAEAQANVAQAQASVDLYRSGGQGAEKQAAELRVKQALINLQEIQLRQKKTVVSAPIDGTILDIFVESGQHGTRGTVVATIADTAQLKLTINVAESDISQIRLQQQAHIKVDAFPGKTFQGYVKHISPVSKSDLGIVNYPVTIQLAGAAKSGIRPGMTSVATLENPELPANSWFVPSSALQQEQDKTTITVLRNGDAYPIVVTSGEVHGEWTVVQSSELQQGDEVVGKVASFVGDQLKTLLGG